MPLYALTIPREFSRPDYWAALVAEIAAMLILPAGAPRGAGAFVLQAMLATYRQRCAELRAAACAS